MTFKVIDKKTGKEADTYKIALKEDWAKCLVYCDIEGFALTEDGVLVLMDECGNVAYCPDDRFEIAFEEEKPQGDLISREALKDAIENQDKFACLPDTKLVPFHMLNEPEKNYEPYVHLRDIRNAIDNAPTVDLWQMRQEATENALKKAEVLYDSSQGSWEKDNIGIYCSVCKRHLDVETPFCPLCGADMRGGAE